MSFEAYQSGLRELLRRVDRGRDDYTDALTLQTRLTDNLSDAQRYGDTETRRAERAQILDALNGLALRALGVSFSELCAGPTPDAARAASEDVRGLLEAMGYRVTDGRVVGDDSYFLCEVKWGADIAQEVVHFVGKTPRAADIAALNDAVGSYDAARGILLTKEPLPEDLREFAGQRKRIRRYTINEFTDRLADFKPYLEQLIADYDASELPRYYVPLSVEALTGDDLGPEVFKPVESFVDAWLAEPDRNHLSILGDFGSGKTWFCQTYAHLTAKRYLADPTANRIPIIITLRDYSRAYDVEQLITDAVANRYKVSLAAGYKTFARLNEAGRLLLIFDGFDEMERRVSDYRTTVDNFWELAKVVSPASKVLLTCRTAYFRHQQEEEETLMRQRRKMTLVAGERVIDLRNRQGFEVAHLLAFTDEDVRLALQRRLPDGWEAVYREIQELANLRDLASRPVLLDMIAQTLPQIKDAREINQATLYEAYVDNLLKRRWSEGADTMPPADRLFLSQELAWEMQRSQRLTIPFSDFPGRVTDYFGLKDDPERAAFLERDLRTQSYLVRDQAGNYRFAHKSFMEYFVARKMAEALARVDSGAATAPECWREQPLSPEVREFLAKMVPDDRGLWQLVESTRKQGRTGAGYAGGNALTLLRMRGAKLTGAALANTILAGASLVNADLSGADLRDACLQDADLTGVALEKTDLRGADLTGAALSEVVEVRAVDLSPDGRDIAFACDDGSVRIWHNRNPQRITVLRGHLGYVRSVRYHPQDGNRLVSSGIDGSVNVWNVRGAYGIFWTIAVMPGAVHRIAVDPSGRLGAYGDASGTVRIRDIERGAQQAAFHGHSDYVSTVNFSRDGQLLASGSYDGMVMLWDFNQKVRLQAFPFGAVVNKVEFSPDGRTVAACGDLRWIKEWQVADGLPRPGLPALSYVYDIAYCPSSPLLAAGDVKGEITVWDLETRKPVRGWRGHDSTVRSLVYTADGKQLVSGGMDGVVSVWDADPRSTDFGKRLDCLRIVMNCRGARIKGATGLDERAPDGVKALGEWLVERGAVG